MASNGWEDNADVHGFNKRDVLLFDSVRFSGFYLNEINGELYAKKSA